MPASSPPATAPAATRAFHSVVRLPNGLAVRCISRRDPPFLYREIYERRCYLQHGLTLPRGGTVIDVGANIGLASLFFAEQLGPEGLVVACEPLPPLHDCMQHNVAAHRHWWRQQQQQQQHGSTTKHSGARTEGVTSSSSRSRGGPAATLENSGSSSSACAPAHILALNMGVGDGSAAEVDFTFYPRAAGWSSMRPAAGEVQADMGAFLGNALASRQAASAAGLGPVTAAAGAALRRWAPGWLYEAAWRAAVRSMLGGSTTYPCRLATVSQIIRDHRLESRGVVDLLKVDVERAELEVLHGIEARHWPLVQQAALEVHETNLEAVLQVLREEAGFSMVEVGQDTALAGSSLHSVFCRRRW